MAFRIKICGVTNIADAQAAVDAGADAIGLNFYPKSKRFIDTGTAREIAHGFNDRVDKIGVFVNESDGGIRNTCRSAGLQLVQLHGDEPPEFLRLLNNDFDIVRARRLDARGLIAVESDLQSCSNLSGFFPDAVLIDAAAAGQYGGTGETVNWQSLVDYKKYLGGVRLILAGGLTPENVAEAIRIVRPSAVDVASGIESSPGKKDHAKVRDFVAAARDAFDDIRPAVGQS